MNNFSKVLAILAIGIFLLLGCKQEKELKLDLLDTVYLSNSRLKVEVLASGLEVPWDLEVDDLGFLWISEQKGEISRMNLQTGSKRLLLKLTDVWKERTSGLLGMTVHPDFRKSPYVYLNYTLKKDSLLLSRLIRYTFEEDSLVKPIVLLEIEAGTSHNGSRLEFGPDGKLYWATGDVHNYAYAQNPQVLNGKILRLNEDGSIPPDNPDPDSYVWALGFRNVQGLVFSSKGLLYTSEHGDAIEDELNLIRKSGNYGWPEIEGKHDLKKELDFAMQKDTREPIRSWTPVIAPAGLTYYDNETIPEWKNSLLLTTLKGKSLRVLVLNENGNEVISEEILFENRYGRLRDVVSGNQGEIYLSTSNLDWNPQPGFPLEGDDKILKISITKEASSLAIRPETAKQAQLQNGKELYLSYCSSCHKADGTGVPDIFPSIKSSQKIFGDPGSLIKLVLKGSEQPGAGQQMPSFAFLDNRQLSEIINYIKTEWTEEKQVITSDIIEQSR